MRRCCRRPSAGRCACSSRARTRWRGRTTGSRTSIDQRVGLDANGTIIAWDYESWSPSLGGRPGYDTPGNVVTGMLAGFEPAPFAPRRLRRRPPAFNNGSNAAPSYVTGCAGGTCGGTGTIKSERVLTHTIRSPFFTGPLRSPSRLQNTFAHESLHGRDRRARQGRPGRVSAATPERSAAEGRGRRRPPKRRNWEARPSPRPGPPGDGHRVADAGSRACSTKATTGTARWSRKSTWIRDTGRVAVTRLVAAQDCGPISNPDGMKNQIEGGALQGLSRALGEEVTWDDQKVTSIDWRTYPQPDARLRQSRRSRAC